LLNNRKKIAILELEKHVHIYKVDKKDKEYKEYGNVPGCSSNTSQIKKPKILVMFLATGCWINSSQIKKKESTVHIQG